MQSCAGPRAVEASGMEDFCDGLSQEEVEAISNFRVEVNMHCAKHSRDAIQMEDAMRFLRATRFNATRAIEIYKNYQKHAESYQLENLRPHREPLSSEIGSKKMEIVGSQDPEGAPLVVFTASRHDVKGSDLKATMQLLFYTLDEVSVRTGKIILTNGKWLELLLSKYAGWRHYIPFARESQENGVTFIVDMRDCSLGSSDFRFMHSMLSVLKDGYPLHLNGIFMVNAPLWAKTQITILKTFKQQSKVKFISLSELSLHFAEDQLPITLGGSYVPGKDHASNHKPTSPVAARFLQAPRPKVGKQLSDPSGFSCTNGVGQEVDDGGSRGAVNNLVGMFECRGKPPLAPGVEKGQDSPADYKTPPLVSKFKRKPSKPESRPQKTASPVNLKKQLGFLHKQSSAPERADPLKMPGKVPILPPSALKAVKLQATSSGPPKSTASVVTTTAVSRPVPVVASSEVRRAPLGAKKVGGASVGIAAIMHNFEIPPQKVNGGGSHQKPSREDKLTASETSPKLKKRPSQEKFAASVMVGGNARPTAVAQEKTKPKRAMAPVKLLRDRETEDDGAGSYPKMYKAAEVKQKGEETKYVAPPPASEEAIYENVAVGNASQTEERAPMVPKHRGPQTKATAPSNPPSAAGNPPAPVQQSDQNPLPAPLRHDYENIQLRTPVGDILYSVESDEESPLSADEDGLGPPEEAIYENFGPDEGNRLMNPEELERHISSKGKKGLSAEYLKIRNEPLMGFYRACKLPCNRTKNRYKDVICYDDTRVILKAIPGLEGSDYIHANFVSGYNKPEAFILTQGPTKKTVVDLWRMLWEKQVFIVVMTTKCVELGRHKCAQYWPEDGTASVMYGNVTVEVTKTQSFDGYDLRTFKVQSKGIERSIMHLQFLAWPDYGVPSSGAAVLQLVMAAREMQAKYGKYIKDAKGLPSYGPPMVVHCSAGVGRSGTFCTIDYCIDELHDVNKTNVQGAMRKLRHQRAFSIQTDEQYEFCYRTVLEYARHGSGGAKRF